jgi:hypothetical protein
MLLQPPLNPIKENTKQEGGKRIALFHSPSAVKGLVLVPQLVVVPSERCYSERMTCCFFDFQPAGLYTAAIICISLLHAMRQCLCLNSEISLPASNFTQRLHSIAAISSLRQCSLHAPPRRYFSARARTCPASPAFLLQPACQSLALSGSEKCGCIAEHLACWCCCASSFMLRLQP